MDAGIGKSTGVDACLRVMRQKKQFEQQMFAAAQRHIDEWPPGIVDATRERPDLVVRHSNGIYGIEVTEVVMSPRRALESARDDVCRKASARLSKLGIWLRVQIFFSDDHPGPRERRNDIAEALACFLRIAAATPDMQRGMYLVPEPADGLPAIRAIDARAVAEPAEAHWNPVSAWWVPTLSSENLQEVIDQKAPQLTHYRQRAPMTWLLIVCNGFRSSSARSIGEAVYSNVYCSDFAGVVLYEHADDRARLLATTSMISEKSTTVPSLAALTHAAKAAS